LALAYFADGWRLPATASSAACAFHLARLYVREQHFDDLLELVSQAEAQFSPPHSTASAAQFFNLIATLADDPRAIPLREELRDRSRMALARKLRQHVEVDTRPGHTVSQLFGQNTSWSAPLARDAEFALKTTLRRPGTPTRVLPVAVD